MMLMVESVEGVIQPMPEAWATGLLPIAAYKAPLPKLVPPTTTVICPVYDNLALTMGFVFNMLEYVKPPDELLVVANGCTDGTVKFLDAMQAQGHNVRHVVSKANLGFSGGHNLGVRSASPSARTFIFLSNDVRATGDFIPPIVQALAATPLVLVGAQLHSGSTGWNEFYHHVRMFFSAPPQPSLVTIPYLAGWCIAMSRPGIAALSVKHLDGPQERPWDERFYPVDFEDIDLSYRAANEGWPLIALDSLPLQHQGSGNTANHLPGGRYAVTLHSLAAFCEKHNLTPAQQH